ncbi:MAG TPA: hypothetical protein VNT81_11410 [Vicinamibacterales bacterium]|nr:hypothetical protein [Vicinamibacterales bacterium]
MNTTATNSSNSNSAINELIAKVMDKYDTNNDKKLNADEFGSFLSGLLEGSGAVKAASIGTEDETEVAATRPAPFAPSTTHWNMMHGFDFGKFTNPGMTSMKYEFARIAADYDPKQPGALERVFNDPRFQAAFPNAQLVGHDGIDFGGQLSDGAGRGVPVFRVDVGETFETNRSGNAWQWLDLVNG